MYVLKQQVLDSLTKLGTTHKDVAATLANKGIQGERQNTDQCPIANYLRTQFPDALVNVGYTAAALLEQHGQKTVVQHPAPIARFIYQFDNGAFPDLDIEPRPDEF